MAQHAKDGDTLEKLESNTWDFVVLQESTRNSIDESLRNTQMIPAIGELDEKIRSQGAQTVVLQMWASITAIDSEGMAHLASEQRRLTEALRGSFQELDVLIAPVGPAWVESLSQRPDLELWGSDRQHASPSGTYLMACVLYASIFQQSPVGLSFTANLPEESALFLQEIAEETRELLGIQGPVDVAGHSMGGMSALAFAIENPNIPNAWYSSAACQASLQDSSGDSLKLTCGNSWTDVSRSRVIGAVQQPTRNYRT